MEEINPSEKSERKLNERKLNGIEIRSLGDLRYAFFCCMCATHYIDDSDFVVKRARMELEDAMNNFLSSMRFIHQSEEHGTQQK